MIFGNYINESSDITPVKNVTNIDIANKDNPITTTTESTIIEGNLFEDNFERLSSQKYLNEAITEDLKKLMKDINNWSTANSKQRMKKFYNNTLDEDEYIMLRKCIKTINESKTYQEYLPAFNKLCRFCSILPEHVIISKYTLKNQSKFKNKYSEGTYSIYVEYYHNNKKITLPEGTKLFHISKVPNIRSLKPFFKGKSERGYIYDKPRIYFTIYKNMPRIMADYKMTDKLYKYQAIQDIKNVYVDPMVWMYTMGAVYIETKNEIPVKLVKTEGFSVL